MAKVFVSSQTLQQNVAVTETSARPAARTQRPMFGVEKRPCPSRCVPLCAFVCRAGRKYLLLAGLFKYSPRNMFPLSVENKSNLQKMSQAKVIAIHSGPLMQSFPPRSAFFTVSEVTSQALRTTTTGSYKLPQAQTYAEASFIDLSLPVTLVRKWQNLPSTRAGLSPASSPRLRGCHRRVKTTRTAAFRWMFLCSLCVN